MAYEGVSKSFRTGRLERELRPCVGPITPVQGVLPTVHIDS